MNWIGIKQQNGLWNFHQLGKKGKFIVLNNENKTKTGRIKVK